MRPTIRSSHAGIVRTVVFFFTLTLALHNVYAEPAIVGEAGLLLDMQTGKILWAKNENKRMAPAGITKILTALVALKYSQPDEMVTVSDAAVATEGTDTGLQAGEQLTLENLLYALLLHSGNDAAIAIANHVGGSVTRFVELMNIAADDLGAENSSFLNPSGLDEDGHYSTATDVALIARAALQNVKLRDIVATRTRQWKSKAWEGVLINDNQLLSTYEGVTGVKTGYTSKAGYCVVATAEQGNKAYLAVVLNSEKKRIWEDTQRLFDYVFTDAPNDTHASFKLLDKNETVLRFESDEVEVALAAAAPIVYEATSEKLNFPRWSITLTEPEPPIAKGERLGELIFTQGGREIGRADLVAAVAVPGQTSLLPKIAWIGWLMVAGRLLVACLRRRRRRNRYLFRTHKSRLSLPR